VLWVAINIIIIVINQINSLDGWGVYEECQALGDGFSLLHNLL
jgi:hypothetical protein